MYLLVEHVSLAEGVFVEGILVSEHPGVGSSARLLPNAWLYNRDEDIHTLPVVGENGVNRLASAGEVLLAAPREECLGLGREPPVLVAPHGAPPWLSRLMSGRDSSARPRFF
ncbi:MAG: hypothetical protein AAB897_02820 [Patescibacteria group bacterium]